METAMPNKNKKISIRQMTMIALMTAVTCILGPLAIPLPFSPVPISFTNLAVYFSLFVLGANSATVSYLVYLLIGMVGLPVFSGFTGGFAKMAGPTGGYLDRRIFCGQISGKKSAAGSGNDTGNCGSIHIRDRMVVRAVESDIWCGSGCGRDSLYTG